MPAAVARSVCLSLAVAAVPAGAAELEEITVTARKVEESMQEAPVSVSALTSDDLAMRSTVSLADVAHLVPNVSFFASGIAGSGSGQAFIRGVGQFDFVLTTDPGVGIYIDGVYLARSLGNMLDLVDIDRVEILRGPQGTLYGKNTVGGAINVISRKPSDTFEAFAEAGTGSYSRFDFRGYASGSLVDDVLTAKISVSTRNADGYGDRLLTGKHTGNQDTKAVQAMLDWKAAQNVDVLFSFDATDTGEEFAAAHTEAYNPAAPLIGLYNALVAPFDARYYTADPFKTNATDSNYNDVDVRGGSATVTWDVGGLTVKSITAYRTLDSKFGTDPDGSPETIIDEQDTNDQNQFSEELQVSGLSFDDRLKWVAGLYYLNEDAKGTFDVKIVDDLFPALNALPGPVVPLGPWSCPQPPGSPLPCLGGPGNPFNNIFNLSRFIALDQTTDSYSVYGQGSYRLTEKLSGTLGLRYTQEKKELDVSAILTQTGDTLIPPTTRSDSWDDVSPRFGLEYQWTGDVLTYISAAKGFKSGGFNGRGSSATEVQSYDPETMWSYEVGLKSEWLDRRLRANFAAFFNKYTDMQFTTQTLENNVQVVLVGNAGEAEVKGMELEFSAVPADALRFDASVGYVDAKYTALDPDVQTITLDSKFIGTPEWTAAVGAEYVVPLGGFGDLRLRADYTYRTKTYFDSSNTESVAQDNYGLLDLRVALEGQEGRWRVTAGVTNVTDEAYRVSGVGVTDTLGFSSAIYGRPREWFLRASLRY